MKKRWWFLMLLGLAVSAVFLYFAFREVEWAELGRVLAAAKPGYFVLAALLVMLSISLRALRWCYVCDGEARRYKPFWSATALGYFANTIYPLRAGETLRVLAIKRLAGVPLGHGAASAVIDRLADGLALGLLLLIVGMIHGEDMLGRRAVDVLRYTFIAAAAFMIVFGIWGKRWRGFFSALCLVLPGRAAVLLMSWYDQAVALIVEVGKPLALLRIGLITIIAFGVDFSIAWTIFQAFDWSLPMAAAVTVETFLAAGSVLPSAPGYVGIFQIASVLALGLYGVSAAGAVAFSIALQVILLFVNVGQGLAVIARHGVGLARQRPREAGDEFAKD
jgi:uncharacterized membrane protein YbhN (UPF0104 family)